MRLSLREGAEISAVSIAKVVQQASYPRSTTVRAKVTRPQSQG
jgi:hypothetical protein